MSFNTDFNFEFPDRFGRNQDRNSTKFRPNYRGRGHQNSQQNQRHFRGRHNSGSHFRQNYKQLVNDFSHQSISPSVSKPKYETIVLELGKKSDKISEDTLFSHFQKTYGAVKKIWFNNPRSKAFISFHNHMSADMCLESGDCVKINGLSIKVHPFQVTKPQELLSTKQDKSFQLKNLCKSSNRSLKGMFPTKQRSDQRSESLPTLSRKQLLDLSQIHRIDENRVLEDILKANDIQQQMNILLDSLLLSDEELEKRNKLKDFLQELLNSNGFECRLHFIGSTVNSLGFRDSDIDIFIETLDGHLKSFDEAMTSLKSIHSILRRTLKMFIPNPIRCHRCPIVRLLFNEIPFVKNANFEALVCDLSLSNALGKRNSRLIRYYCRLEPRFQQLALLLRFWAKLNGFVGSSYMSSYAFTHLVVFFCQNEGLLPTVDRLRQSSDGSKIEPLMINGWDSSFSEDIEVFSDNQRNNDSILELLEKFFAFYSDFDFNHLIICTKTGLTKHKSEAFIQMDKTSAEEVSNAPLKWFRLTPIISIEDPFELSHNLCANFNYKTFDKFCEYLTHFCRNFKQIFVEKCEEMPIDSEEKPQKPNDNYWGLSPLCREWDPTPTGYGFPDQYIGFANLDLILSSDSNKSPKDLMQLMANRLIDLTDIWLSKVYRIESLLLSKWHLICGQLSPFAEFYIKVRALDIRAIDSLTRNDFREKFTKELSEEKLKELSFTEIETEVTNRIHDQFDSDLKKSKAIPIDCHFALVMNCRLSFPTVELVLIDFKPGFESSKALMNFLRRMIANAANDSRLLTCPHEITS